MKRYDDGTMVPQIEEVFELEGEIFRARRGSGCEKCHFDDKPHCPKVACGRRTRTDGNDIYLERVNEE